MTEHVTVAWLRRDLRLHDHPALTAAAAGHRLAPLFIFDDGLLAGSPAPNRVWFMLESVRALADSLAARGSRLHLRHGSPPDVVAAFAREIGADEVHVTRDHTPYGRERDAAVHARLAAIGVSLHRHPGNLVHEPEQLVRPSGRHHAVYSPFRRAWDALPRREVLGAPMLLPPPPAFADPGALPAPASVGAVATADPGLLPAPGEAAARARMEHWLTDGIDRYHERRDRLDLDGTSRISQDLRFGLLSPVELVERAAGAGEGRRRYLAELAWRDFYAHLLWHEPRLRREAFHRELDAVGTPGGGAADQAWREGRTGYPTIDAAMRQLAAMGWMHNRARMVVASFLAKDLLVDRRVGEAHFFAHLVDGDPASNNGGWQWAASTGTDPQPYFRVFNPVLQGRRFDPEGTYVRRWLPELARVPDDFVHAPWTMPPEVQAQAGCRIGVDYPAPIVDHGEARGRAIAAYRAARRGSAVP